MQIYALYTNDRVILAEKTVLFDAYVRPLLNMLDIAVSSGVLREDIPELDDYLEVCAWPFRQLEYSFALRVLLDHLNEGHRYLDAGAGVTPFAYAIANLGVDTFACDSDQRIVQASQEIMDKDVYGTSVAYDLQDLTRLTYPDNFFDAVSCISVLEHIAAPEDQRALLSLIRILKPGGVLVITVDFSPFPQRRGWRTRADYLMHRGVETVRAGNMMEFWDIARRKMTARKAVARGEAHHVRTANQRFEVQHLQADLMPLLASSGQMLESELHFSSDLDSITAENARQFWDLEPGLFEKSGSRAVLPVGFIFQKNPLIITT